MGYKIAAVLFALGAFAPADSQLQGLFGLGLAIASLLLEQAYNDKEFYSKGWTAQQERAAKLEAQLKGQTPVKSDLEVLDDVIENTRRLILSPDLKLAAMQDFELLDVVKKLEALRSGADTSA